MPKQQTMCEAWFMSHAVDPTELAPVAKRYGSTPFLLYSSNDGAARVNHVVAQVEDGQPLVRVSGFGRGVIRRVADGAPLSLLWPATDTEEFSLIADGTGEIDASDESLTITVSAAVLHRPAPVGGSDSC